jgi:hypothetical protein
VSEKSGEQQPDFYLEDPLNKLGFGTFSFLYVLRVLMRFMILIKRVNLALFIIYGLNQVVAES